MYKLCDLSLHAVITGPVLSTSFVEFVPLGIREATRAVLECE